MGPGSGPSGQSRPASLPVINRTMSELAPGELCGCSQTEDCVLKVVLGAPDARRAPPARHLGDPYALLSG